jgi:hypothetical protein
LLDEKKPRIEFRKDTHDGLDPSTTTSNANRPCSRSYRIF